MDFLPFFVIASIIIIIVIAIYLQKFFVPEKLENLNESLLKFSTDIKFNPFPQIINVENPYQCSGRDLHRCTLDNQLSCIGCRSLIASCVHFEKDTEFIDADGTRTIIEKNETENDGYCLTITSVEETCNLYHGDLALVQITPDNSDSMIICNCRNPGLIGNTTVRGACDTIFVCDGQIDNINQPMDNVKCICAENAINVSLNNIPSCQLKTVLNASDDGTLNSLLVKPDENFLLANNPNVSEINFNYTISQNVKSTHLLNPCSRCPITNKIIPNVALGKIGSGNKFCSITFDQRFKSNLGEYFGIPMRRSPTERILAGLSGPDSILGVYWEEVIIYTRLENYIQRFIFIIKSDNNNEFYEKLQLDKSQKYAIKVDDILLGVHLPLPEISRNAFPMASCVGHWPSYSCNWSQIGGISQFQSIIPIEISPVANNSNALNYNTPRPVPGAFLWNREDWNDMESLNIWWHLKDTEIDGVPVKYITYDEQYFTNRFANRVKLMAWGFQVLNNIWRQVFYTNGNNDDWLRLRNSLIEYN